MGYLKQQKIYAFDFDGTLCKDAFPAIGTPKKSVLRFARNCKKHGHRIILWTCRNGELLDEAIHWCRMHGLEFDAVNENLPEIKAIFGSDSRKITADYYIDDRMVLPVTIILSFLVRLWEIT